MERSLIQLSPSTAVVSLPAAWIERNKLHKGAKLCVEENENRIVISTQSKKSDQEITLDVSKLDGRLLWMAMDSAFTAGYDVITVHTRDQEQAAYMDKVVRFHPGMIIEDERKNVVRMRDIAQDSQQEFDKLLSRIFNYLVAIFEDGIEAQKARDWKTLTEMKRRDYNLNMYIALSQRHLSKYGHKPFSKTGIVYTYTKMLEMLSDKLVKLLVGMGQQRSAGKSEQQMLADLLALFRQTYTLHYKYSQAGLVELERHRERLLSSVPRSGAHLQLYMTELLELFYELEELESALHV